MISGTTAFLFLLSCFTVTFVVTRSPLTAPFRLVGIRAAHKLHKKLGDKVEYLLSCWLCSGVWSSLFSYLVMKSLAGLTVSEAFLCTASGAAVSFVIGRVVDLIDVIIDSKSIEVIPADVFDSAKSGVETSGTSPNQ